MITTEPRPPSKPTFPTSTADLLAPVRQVSAGLRRARSNVRTARDNAQAVLLPVALCSALVLLGAALASPPTAERPLLAAAAVLLLSLTWHLGGAPGAVLRTRATTPQDEA